MSEPEVTNPEKAKNPKRVEQGKRLSAISREAKERKKQQQEKFFKSAEQEGNKIFFGIGLIGAAFLIYKIFFNSKKDAQLPEEPTDVRPPTEPEKPEEVEVPQTPTKPTKSTEPAEPEPRSYEPYTMD